MHLISRLILIYLHALRTALYLRWKRIISISSTIFDLCCTFCCKFTWYSFHFPNSPVHWLSWLGEPISSIRLWKDFHICTSSVRVDWTVLLTLYVSIVKTYNDHTVKMPNGAETTLNNRPRFSGIKVFAHATNFWATSVDVPNIFSSQHVNDLSLGIENGKKSGTERLLHWLLPKMT